MKTVRIRKLLSAQVSDEIKEASKARILIMCYGLHPLGVKPGEDYKTNYPVRRLIEEMLREFNWKKPKHYNFLPWRKRGIYVLNLRYQRLQPMRKLLRGLSLSSRKVVFMWLGNGYERTIKFIEPDNNNMIIIRPHPVKKEFEHTKPFGIASKFIGEDKSIWRLI